MENQALTMDAAAFVELTLADARAADQRRQARRWASGRWTLGADEPGLEARVRGWFNEANQAAAEAGWAVSRAAQMPRELAGQAAADLRARAYLLAQDAENLALELRDNAADTAARGIELASSGVVESLTAWGAGLGHFVEGAVTGAGRGFGAYWDEMWPYILGVGIVGLLLAGGAGYLLMSGGGQQLLIGGGKALGGLGAAAVKVAL